MIMDNKQLNKAADNIRILSMATVEKANSGHPGGAMGGADFINLLYAEFLNFDPDDLSWPFRDRFFLDPGHMSAMLYSVLSFVGAYSTHDLQLFRQWGSATPGHPELDIKRGVENTSGPLGQGHAMAAGAAIANKFLAARFGDWMLNKTYAFISDGGIQEEISQGVGRIAGHLGLNNLIMFFDSNDVQLSTRVDEVTSEDTEAKYRAWGWRVLTINGNDVDEIRGALLKAQEEKEKPFLIIGKTVMGKGLVQSDGASFEGKVSTHGQPVSHAGADFKKSIINLGGNPEEPFAVFQTTRELYQEVLDEKRKTVAAKKQQFALWKTNNPKLSQRLQEIFSGRIPQIDFEQISLPQNGATRAASANILGQLALQLDSMIVMSADLANSDKTDGFLKKSRPITANDFGGAFLHAGVSELTMASIANGLALSYLIPVCGTFFVFSDYMKPAVRLAALMELPVKYVWTHDSFRVGEDGPTHQPVEHEAQIRLMEKLKNHHGQNAMLVLRPADVYETAVAWQMALKNRQTPTALILSRQNITNLPLDSGMLEFESANKANRGAYTVVNSADNPDLILLASGSEVSTLIAARELILKDRDIKINVVSVISEGLFNNQDVDYRNSVLPENVPVFGLTAGLPATLQGLVGNKGNVLGLDHFGYSAPYTELDEQFGFVPESVKNSILDFIG